MSSQIAKYAVAAFPGVSWLAIAAVVPGFRLTYDSAIEIKIVGLASVVVVVAGAIISIPVVVAAFRRLCQGTDIKWVVVSLLFSFPVFVLTMIALFAVASHAGGTDV